MLISDLIRRGRWLYAQCDRFHSRVALDLTLLPPELTLKSTSVSIALSAETVTCSPYPKQGGKCALHPAAIDAMKPDRDREAFHAMVARMKQRREREAEQALNLRRRLATLAKTERLRAERLARTADAQSKKTPKS